VAHRTHTHVDKQTRNDKKLKKLLQGALEALTTKNTKKHKNYY